MHMRLTSYFCLSENQTCAPGWFQHPGDPESCLMIGSTGTASWTDSQDICTYSRSNLVSISNETEYQSIKGIIHYQQGITFINPFQMTVLDSSKLKEFADNNFKFDKNGRKFSKWVENAVGKGAISPFPTVFSKDLYCKHTKTRACLGKGYIGLFKLFTKQQNFRFVCKQGIWRQQIRNKYNNRWVSATLS